MSRARRKFLIVSRRVQVLYAYEFFQAQRIQFFSETEHYCESMSQNLTTYAIGQMPQVTSPNLLYMKVMCKLATHRFDGTSKSFTFAKLFTAKRARLSVLRGYRKLKSLFSKKLLFDRLRNIGSISQRYAAVTSDKFIQHSQVVNIGWGHFKCLNHTQRVDLDMESKTIKSLVAKLFAIGGDTSKKLAEPGPGEPTDRNRKAVNDGNDIFELFCDMVKKSFLNKPKICCVSDEVDSVSQGRKVVLVEIPEKSEDVFIGVKPEDFADDFHCKHFTISQLRQRPSGSYGSCRKEIFHKIISFAEDIYDKIIKVHFLALHDQWNNFCFLSTYSIGLRAFLLSICAQKLVHGVNIFMMFEPLAGKRYVKITQRRTKIDWARCMHQLVDEIYPQAEQVVLVMDNLNTHSKASLYEAFEPTEAKRIADKLEIHYTPRHGSWLNMAEIEMSVLSRQCLAERMGDMEHLEREALAWEHKRNSKEAKADWRFTTEDARIKLKKLYPSIEM